MAPAEKEISSVTTSKEDDKINSKEVTIEHPLTTGYLSEMTVIAEGEDRTTLFVWLLVFCCGISGLLFGMRILRSNQLYLSLSDFLFQGYDTGVISGALVSINTDLDNKVLTTLEKVIDILRFI